jgi:uncharacterized protein YdeI (YjbR/CyaY-like superfamily)
VAESPPVLSFESPEELEAWLDSNHASVDGVWLKFAKKGSGIRSVVYAEALDVALCYGWIDGQAKPIDEHWYMQRFTPRRKRAKWSKRNRGKVEELTAAGRMKPAGLAEVERARADGRWDAAYDSHRTAVVPEDLQRALDAASPGAREFFAGLSSTNRYAIL